MKRFLFTALLSFVLGGCAIKQSVTPLAQLEDEQVCVVENPAVSKAGFLKTYQSALTTKGYNVRQLAANAEKTTCKVTSTYTANWSWDLAMYMVYAEIKVFNKGQLSGEAVYDARSGGANWGKFINAEEKITELVDQLFPNRAR